MPAFAVPELMPALPEIFLASAAMALIMLGAFRGEDSTRAISWLAVLALVVAAIAVPAVTQSRVTTFAGLFVTDAFAVFMKELILLGSALAIIMSVGFNEREKIARFEYPILFLFATLGMMLMVSANDLIALYLGLELQSLSLYVVAAFRRDTVRSSEAGLKYFVLGALSSGMLLYGCSMIYGFTGTTRFDVLAAMFAGVDGVEASIGLIVGLVFLVAGLAFKVAAVPFHMWIPDVYEGAPTPVTTFFAAAPKIAAMALFIRVLVGPFGDLADQWQQIIIFISIASMILGALAAINQTNIKRLMAYSAIGHVGYALVGLAAGGEIGVRGVLIYMAIYLAMVLGTFGCILCMRVHGRMVEGIDDLAGLAKTHPMVALALAIFMFSMSGIPPLAGFFAKIYVFLAAIQAGLYTLAVIGVLTSVVAAFYYLRIVKLMYFDEPVEAFDRPIGRGMGAILVGTGVFTLFFFAYPGPVLNSAAAAAAALFAG
ncbi:MAG: NADH-quinone oxidoreductase subunit NuoN [Alphaproteobacteria bacterium]